MPETPLVTIPLEIDPKLLEKIRASQAAIAPGKRGKLVASIDLKGNLSIGVGARVGAGARVEATVLGPETIVGEGSNLLRSVVLRGATVAPGERVTDMVVSPEAVLPCG